MSTADQWKEQAAARVDKASSRFIDRRWFTLEDGLTPYAINVGRSLSTADLPIEVTAELAGGEAGVVPVTAQGSAEAAHLYVTDGPDEDHVTLRVIGPCRQCGELTPLNPAVVVPPPDRYDAPSAHFGMALLMGQAVDTHTCPTP